MNLVKLQSELENDEGIKHELYLCSESHLTGGIGHLITEWDTEYYNKPVGTKVPNEQVNEWFENDIRNLEVVSLDEITEDQYNNLVDPD